jgi:hypothetical protein
LRHLVLVFLPISIGCNAVALAVLTSYKIDRTSHQQNLERLRDAAALAELGSVEAAEGASPLTRVI